MIVLKDKQTNNKSKKKKKQHYDTLVLTAHESISVSAYT